MYLSADMIPEKPKRNFVRGYMGGRAQRDGGRGRGRRREREGGKRREEKGREGRGTE